MAYKMKGFPLRSGFKHADTGHSEKDHQHIEAGETEEKTDTGTGETEEWRIQEIKAHQSTITALSKPKFGDKYAKKIAELQALIARLQDPKPLSPGEYTPIS